MVWFGRTACLPRDRRKNHQGQALSQITASDPNNLWNRSSTLHPNIHEILYFCTYKICGHEKFNSKITEETFVNFKENLIELISNFIKDNTNKGNTEELKNTLKIFGKDYIENEILSKIPKDKKISGLNDKNVPFKLVYDNIKNFDYKRTIKTVDSPFDYEDYFMKYKKYAEERHVIDLDEVKNQISGLQASYDGEKTDFVKLIELLFSLIAFRSQRDIDGIKENFEFLKNLKSENSKILKDSIDENLKDSIDENLIKKAIIIKSLFEKYGL